mmetsp:Transcript_27591/g.54107  ORF Transcript_27591/g.54107 Transcript_27591/m.54107 type:complete len:402 (+) Transcript_27591:79-1284(+)
MPSCKHHKQKGSCTKGCAEWVFACFGGLPAGPVSTKRWMRNRVKRPVTTVPSLGELPTVPRLKDVVAQRIHIAQLAKHFDGFGERVSWRNGNHELFRLRRGPNYPCNGFKAVSGPPLYRCVGVDIVKAKQQIRQASRSLEGMEEVVGLGGQTLPQMILVNFQVPFHPGYVVGKHPHDDAGCSILLYFKLETHTLQTDLQDAPPSAKLLGRYLEEDGHPKREGTWVSGCLKAVGILENSEDLGIPSVLMPIVRKFNGRPVLVEREMQRYGQPSRNGIVELAVDIRGFNPVARSMLCRLRGQLRHAQLQIGLVVQACSDEELPEQLLGAVQFSGLDLLTGLQVEEQCNAEAFGSSSQAADTFGQLFTTLRDRIAGLSCTRRRTRRCCPSRNQLGNATVNFASS